MIHLILLSGGSGTRLWPLSNDARSKQFLKVLRDEQGDHVSMVQRVFSQIEKIDVPLDITIATCENQCGSIERQLEGNYSLVLEPERRDTAPAIMLACAFLALTKKANEGDTVIVMPIDTYADQAYYNQIIKLDKAVQSNIAELILLGAKPTYPSEKYGYIIPASVEGEVFPVAEFKEKPNEQMAISFIEQGGLWNCGVFAFKLKYIEQIRKSYLAVDSYTELVSRYTELPKNSFDYEIVEKAQSIAVVPYVGEWKDLGTWNTLSEEMEEPYSGRVIVDEATCNNVHVINETGLPMVVAGLSNAVVIATPDGILASSKQASANIKDQVKEAAVSRAMYEQRRWGEYRVLDASVYPDGSRALTKELVIDSGKQLSYQVHHHRAEAWTIVSGYGEVVLNGLVREVRSGSIIYIRPGEKHSARAFEEMHVIEVQTGDVLVEEDIERFGYYWK